MYIYPVYKGYNLYIFNRFWGSIFKLFYIQNSAMIESAVERFLHGTTGNLNASDYAYWLRSSFPVYSQCMTGLDNMSQAISQKTSCCTLFFV